MPHTLAGQTPDPHTLTDIPKLVTAFYTGRPDASIAVHRVSFGTSGHRGSSLENSFNEWHVLAITQAICEYRTQSHINGPLFMGKDTHALSEPAFVTALEVLAGNGVDVMIDGGYTPTPALSHAILTYNRGRTQGLSDGIVMTPSHNPPEDGGFKYNPPHGGPADTNATRAIQDRANAIMADGIRAVKRHTLSHAMSAATTHRYDFRGVYVADLGSVVDMDAIRSSGLAICADALGGAGVTYWGHIGERYGLNLTVANDIADPTFRFMRLDWDGRVRMDCSSPYAMAGLIALKDEYDIAFACDPDHDRHGIVTPSGGLMNPNHYLSASIDYLFANRSGWRPDAGVGKTLVSSSMIDRVAAGLGRRLVEVPVGFKWFVDGLLDGGLGFGGEESAGASFLRTNGGVWTTDKDGLILGLLAAEITARTGEDPARRYRRLTERYGAPIYERIDAPATPQQKAVLLQLSPEQVTATELAGEPIEAMLTRAPGNGAPIGGLKVVTKQGWFAARPSGTEDVYKLYAESFQGEEHLRRIQREARAIISMTLAATA